MLGKKEDKECVVDIMGNKSRDKGKMGNEKERTKKVQLTKMEKRKIRKQRRKRGRTNKTTNMVLLKKLWKIKSTEAKKI